MTTVFKATSEQQRADRFSIGVTFVVVMLTFVISGVYASIYCRGLYQDGAYHLFRMAGRGSFYLCNPPRLAVEAMRQAPVVAMLKMGELSLVRLAEVSSLTMLSLPGLLVAICWLIARKDRKVWTLFPAIHLLVGFSTMSFEAVAEGAIAASYFWVLLFLLLFRTRKPVSQLIFLILCVPAFQIDEGAFLLMPVLVAAIVLRLKGAMTWSERLFLSCGALMAISIMAYEMSWVIHPRIPGEPGGALHAILTFGFLYFEGRINLPVVTALAAIAALSVTFFFHDALSRFAGKHSNVIAAAFAAFAVIMIGVAWGVDKSFTPGGQSLARYNPIFASIVLGALTVFGVNKNPCSYSWARGPTLAIVTLLSLTQMATDLAATTRWRLYIRDFESRVAQSRGLVKWESTAITGDRARDVNWQLMTIGWVHPIISIILSRNGDVRSILDYPPDTTFRPIEVSDPRKLPTIRGISFENYKRWLGSSPTV
jgi:hypothetical protein